MREVKRYHCDYCSTLRATKTSMEKHEAQCIHNPNSVNCFRCECSCLTDWDTDSEYSNSTLKDVPVCAYEEDIITENRASKCHMFRRSGKGNYERTYEEASANMERIMNESEVSE